MIDYESMIVDLTISICWTSAILAWVAFCAVKALRNQLNEARSTINAVRLAIEPFLNEDKNTEDETHGD